jgi:glycosyltransferase involved in cell wall biosynthesis
MSAFYSIVVPTLNRAAMLARGVRSLLAQRASCDSEIIVVDNNSTDGTREEVRALAAQARQRLRYVMEREPGVAAARNAGVLAARGEVIAFVDDDAVVQPGWLDALESAYRAHAGAWCIGGKISLTLPQEPPSWFSSQSNLLRDYLSGLDLGDGTIELREPREAVFGANFSVRRGVFDRVGLFDPALGVAGRRRLECDEIELCWRIRRAGGRIYYCGGAGVSHVVPAERLSKRFFRNRSYWRGRTAGLIARDALVASAPSPLVRGLARLAISRTLSLFDSKSFNPSRIFRDELECWRRLGYLHQRLLAGGDCRRDGRPKAGKMETRPCKQRAGL